MTLTLSPVHPCPRCGVPVQLAERAFGRTRVEDAQTGQRHECEPRPYTPPLPVIECPDCGRPVVRTYDTLRTWRFGDLCEDVERPVHECRQTSGNFRKLPEVSTVPAPVKVEMAQTGPRRSIGTHA